jgi:hypothetical protein
MVLVVALLVAWVLVLPAVVVLAAALGVRRRVRSAELSATAPVIRLGRARPVRARGHSVARQRSRVSS